MPPRFDKSRDYAEIHGAFHGAAYKQPPTTDGHYFTAEFRHMKVGPDGRPTGEVDDSPPPPSAPAPAQVDDDDDELEQAARQVAAPAKAAKPAPPARGRKAAPPAKAGKAATGARGAKGDVNLAAWATGQETYRFAQVREAIKERYGAIPSDETFAARILVEREVIPEAQVTIVDLGKASTMKSPAK